jgi:hypothetical protein
MNSPPLEQLGAALQGAAEATAWAQSSTLNQKEVGK